MRLAWVFFSRVKQREVVIRVDNVVEYQTQNGVRVAAAELYRTKQLAYIPLDQLVIVP